jgi:undecaprenyl-diphosphatase
VNALLGYLSASDARLSVRMRRWSPPRWFRLWMITATRFGDGWGWFLLAALLLSAGTPAYRALAAGTFATALANVVLVFLKRRVRRRRPCVDGSHPVFHIDPPDEFSFPSGHATNAFAIATVLSIVWPPASPALAVLAVSIAASRVVLGLHYVTDVAAGALIGSTCALAALYVV